ncbi:MAG TPA: glycosyltransferase family 4 protein, partial [Micromonosporaceae bacterium]|nr:glycosyltransferase family 4 protein [Micromonosporaceae bacterium]
GERDELFEMLPESLHDRVTFLGKVSEADKARMLRSVDIYVAPNTRGESFGMILTEALAAGTPIVASDLDAFRRVLDGGKAGLLFPTGDTEALTKALRELLDDPAQRAAYAAESARVVAEYDWKAVAQRVLEVYALAIEATTGESVHVDAATSV